MKGCSLHPFLNNSKKKKKKEWTNEKLAKNITSAERNIIQLNKIIYIDTSIHMEVLPGIFLKKHTKNNHPEKETSM